MCKSVALFTIIITTRKKHSESADLRHTHKQMNGDWRLLAVAPPKYYQLLTHIRIFPENLNEIHALVFKLHCEKKKFLTLGGLKIIVDSGAT